MEPKKLWKITERQVWLAYYSVEAKTKEEAS